MEHAKDLQLHNIATWDVRHLPTTKSLVCPSFNRSLAIFLLLFTYIPTYTYTHALNVTWQFNAHTVYQTLNEVILPETQAPHTNHVLYFYLLQRLIDQRNE